MLAADRRDVEALDPHRQLLHPQRLGQRGQRLDPAGAAVLAPQPVLVEGELGVALGQLAQPAFVAALGGAHLDRGAAALAQRLGEHLGAVAQVGADDDRPRHRRRGRVVLADELLGDLGRLALALVLEVEALALGEDPVADLEDLGVGVGALDRDPDQVGGPDRAPATRWRSNSERIAFSRSRWIAARSNSCAAAAASIFSSSSRSTWR